MKRKEKEIGVLMSHSTLYKTSEHFLALDTCVYTVTIQWKLDISTRYKEI